jgi:hypothetical protein
MEEQAKPKGGRKKGSPPTKTSWTDGQSGNPAGRPKLYKNADELREEIFRRYQIYVSGKMWTDLDKMNELKRFENWQKLITQWRPDLSAPQQEQLPAGDMKIQVVFGKPEPKQETIELKQTDEGESYA